MFDTGSFIAGRYRLLEPYPGVLPYGQMWVAEDTFLSTQVRMILSEQLPQESVLRAVASAALVDSDALVKVVSLCSEDDPFTWVCTQLPMGTPLSAFLDEQESLEGELVHALTGELARLLSLLRTNDVVHLQLAPQWVRISDRFSVGLDGAGVLAGLAGVDLEALPRELDRLEARGLCAFAARLLWGDSSASDDVLFERMAGMDLPDPLANLFERERSGAGVLSPAEAVRVLTPWGRLNSMPRQRVFSPWFRPYQHTLDLSASNSPAPVAGLVLPPEDGSAAFPRVAPQFPPVHSSHEQEIAGFAGDAASPASGSDSDSNVAEGNAHTVAGHDALDVKSADLYDAELGGVYDSELGIIPPPHMTMAPQWISIQQDTCAEHTPDDPTKPLKEPAQQASITLPPHAHTSANTTHTKRAEDEQHPANTPSAPETSAVRKAFRFDEHKRVNSSKIATLGALGVVVVAGLAAAFALSTPLQNVDIPAPAISATPSEKAKGTPPSEASTSKPSTTNTPSAANTPVQIVAATLLNPYAAKVNPTNVNAQDNPTLLARIFDEDPSSSWQSWRYNQKNFSGKGGIGIALKLANATPVRSVSLNVNGEGGQVQWRATTADAPDSGDVLASASLGANTVLSVDKPVESDTVILWFSELPTAPDGKNRIDLSEVHVNQ